MSTMNRLLLAGIAALLAIAVAGLWLIISPFLIGSQPSGAIWLPSTLNAVIVGALLVLLALLGVLLALALHLRDAVRAAPARLPASPAGRPPGDEPPRGPAPQGQAIPGAAYAYGPSPAQQPPRLGPQGQPAAYPPIYDPVYDPSAHNPYAQERAPAGWEPAVAASAMPPREPRPPRPAPPRSGPESWPAESWPAGWEDDGYTHSSTQRPNPPRAGVPSEPLN